MSVPKEIDLCFSAAINLANYRLPYEFGGGHPGPGLTNGQKGYDCSGWCSDILRHGGIEESNEALDVKEFASWGDEGEGQYMTLWYHIGPELEHCFLEFKIPNEEQFKFSMAAHTGTICGWYKEISTAGYSCRRRK